MKMLNDLCDPRHKSWTFIRNRFPEFLNRAGGKAVKKNGRWGVRLSA